MRYTFPKTGFNTALWGGLLVLLLTACQSSPSQPNNTPTKHGSSEPSSDSLSVVPLPTSAPIPASDELLAQALSLRSIGKHEEEAIQLQLLLANYPNASEVRQARYYLAESFARRQRWSSAVESFQLFIEGQELDNLTMLALFWLARCYEESGNWTDAVATYERYRSFKPILAPYAAIREAAQYQALGQREQAAHLYEVGGGADIDRAQRAGSIEKAIALYRQLGQREKVLQLYESLLQLAEIPTYRARILIEASLLATDMGQREKSNNWLREIIAVAPTSPQAVSAVQTLTATGDTQLLPSDAARVFFQAELYASALPFFDAALQQMQQTHTFTDDDVLEIRRLRALTLRGLRRFSEALEALATISSDSPNSPPGRQAQLDWIQTIGQSGDLNRAIQNYKEFAATYQDDPRAPVALDRAAQLLDRMGNSQSAFLVRMELEQRYPHNTMSVFPLHAHALALFQQGQFAEAQRIWLQIAEGRQGNEKAMALFWAARTVQQPSDPQARIWFEESYQAAPDTYYGTRSAEECGTHQNPTVLLGTPMTEQDWQLLEAWVATWSGQPRITVATQGYPQEVIGNGFVQRAIALEQVGLHTEAIAEWNAIRATWKDDPTKLMLLVRIAHDHEATSIALNIAEQLAKGAPSEAKPFPDTLRRLIYPTPYSTVVLEQARIRTIDPRIIYALMRQESLFNPQATSWVGARGLGQVMPTTGEEIARQLNIADFHIDDLYHPYLSIQFGTYYIAQQIKMMEGSIQGGLSAYNGGPGNAQTWAKGTHVADADLFTENITFNETRSYVKLVYGFYGAYRSLYAVPFNP